MNKEDLFNQAYELQCQNQLSEAILLYEQLLEQDQNNTQAWHFLGIAKARLNQHSEAIIALQKALSFEPDNAIIHNNLANAYKGNEQLDKAIVHYQKAIDLDNNYAQAHHNLANLYALQDEYQQALHHYRAALHALPDFVVAHFNLGLLLLKHQQISAAKKQFNNVLTLNPAHTEASFYLAVLLLEDNDLSTAKAHFQSILKQNPQHVEALTNLGVIALKEDQGQLAVDYFSKALAINNNHLEARNNLAATFMHYDRFENALMHYDVLLKNEPQNKEYLYNCGVAQMALGHLSEALVHFETLVELDKHHFAALNNLAAIYIRLEDRLKARQLLEQALAANPEDASSRHMLNALTGEQTQAGTCPEYAANLFNNYALYYDQHLRQQLHYRLPEHIAQALQTLPLTKNCRTLDLGCGTGLMGQVVREFSHKLVGVDIAAKMITQAKEKKIYDDLYEDHLLHFLQQHQQQYDLILAADVLPYFSDLEALFAALQSRLASGGYFVFSTEISTELDWQLQDTARFSHHPAYINKLCSKYTLSLLQQKRVIARQQEGKAVEVMLSIAQLL